MTTVQNESASHLKPYKDLSLWVLLFANLLTAYFVIKDGYGIITAMWIYWLQSVIIGFFNFIRILTLKEFTTDNLKWYNKQTFPLDKVKIVCAFFFLIHYGFFHLVYLVFLFVDSLKPASQGKEIISFSFIFLSGFLFFINHLFSFFFNREKEHGVPNIGRLMTDPYVRILPMHFTIILGSFAGAGLLPFFLILKTLADMILHLREHKLFRNLPIAIG